MFYSILDGLQSHPICYSTIQYMCGVMYCADEVCINYLHLKTVDKHIFWVQIIAPVSVMPESWYAQEINSW